MPCARCGLHLAAGATFCQRCGQPVAQPATTEGQAPSPHPPGSPQPPTLGQWPPAPPYGQQSPGPILVGGAAITCAVIARNRKETRAPAALAVAVGGTVAGFILSAIVRQNFY